MKYAHEIVKWGKVKRFENKSFTFYSLDIETIDGDVFLIGSNTKGKYKYTLNRFYDYLHSVIIEAVQNNATIVTWTRYDNTFIIKTLLEHLSEAEQLEILSKIGRISPLYSWSYNNFSITLDNIIADNVILSVTDDFSRSKKVNILNLKNLFPKSDLLKASKDYGLKYYSKLGEEYHRIDKARFKSDPEYRSMVIKANELDNKVVIDLADKLIANYFMITGEYPRTIYTAGSLARAYLLTMKDVHFNYSSLYRRNKHFENLLDYSMRSYHGGKIESYVLGYISKAKIIDITSAYPDSLSKLPRLTKKVIKSNDIKELDKYFYAFINCTITITDPNFIHPISIPSPTNSANISPWGTFDAIITKPEYDYLLAHNVKIIVHDFYAIVSINDSYPYKNMIEELFSERIKTKKTNVALSELYKLILNSLYGITYELTDVFDTDGEWIGFRAGDFFNPVIASYITALTRVKLSEASNNVIENKGNVYLNMTDSLIYSGKLTLDIFSKEKILGTFEPPTVISDILILGAGRYEYKNDFTGDYTIKTRGFSVKKKKESFYGKLPLTRETVIKNKTLVTFFKATTKKFNFKRLGHIIEEDYVIDPFNLGGKRIICDLDVNLKVEYTKTKPIKL